MKAYVRIQFVKIKNQLQFSQIKVHDILQTIFEHITFNIKIAGFELYWLFSIYHWQF